MSSSDVLKLIQEKEAKWADLRFTDTRGKGQRPLRCDRARDDAGLRALPG
jgi:glutamine synthetase